MRGSFFGLNVSISGLFAAQRNLDTIGHNIANLQTDGYSRQAVYQNASSPIRLYNHTGMVGTGVDVVSVARVRDFYLDKKYWFQSTIRGEWAQKASSMSEILTRIDETNGGGYSTSMNEFYSVLQELSKDPTDMSIRSVVKEEAQSLASYFNSLAVELDRIQEDLNFDVKAKVELINSIGHRIETLNRQIYKVEILGERANDLRDARDLLVDELSSLVDVEVGEHNFGKLPSGADDMRFYVYIGGVQFLQHFNSAGSVVNELRCVARDAKVNEEDVPGLYDVVWTKAAGDGDAVRVTGGALRGVLDVRDGNASLVQQTKFDMLGTKFEISLNLPGATPPQPSTLSIDVAFDEYVADVSQMTAAQIADHLERKINEALGLAGVDVRPDNRAAVYVDAGGRLAVDLGGVDVGGVAGGTDNPRIDAFVFTAGAKLKQDLGLAEVVPLAPGTGTATALTSSHDISNAYATLAYKGVPYYQRKLDEYVRVFAMAFNEGFIDQDTDKAITPDEVLTGHADGWNINQKPGEPPAAVRFFTMMDSHGNPLGTGDFMAMSDGRMPSLYALDPDSPEYGQNINAIRNAYSKVTAKSFSVSADIMNDPSLIATSGAAGDVEDNSNLRAVMSQRFNRHMFSEGSAEDFMQSLTTDAAVNTSHAEFMEASQDKFVELLATKRMSVSGVWQDEEFADMIRQQNAYNASAMMINTFSGIYDTLINRLGL